MPQISLNKKVKRLLKRYKVERIMLWIIAILGGILTIMGFFLFSYIGKLYIVQRIFAMPTADYVIAQIKGLLAFAYVLSITFSIMGAIIIGFAVDKLIISKTAYQMASYIKQINEEKR